MPFPITAKWDPNLQRYFHKLGMLFVFYCYYWLDRKLSLKEDENPKYTDMYELGRYWFLHLGWHHNDWTRIQQSSGHIFHMWNTFEKTMRINSLINVDVFENFSHNNQHHQAFSSLGPVEIVCIAERHQLSWIKKMPLDRKGFYACYHFSRTELRCFNDNMCYR